MKKADKAVGDDISEDQMFELEELFKHYLSGKWSNMALFAQHCYHSANLPENLRKKGKT